MKSNLKRIMLFLLMLTIGISSQAQVLNNCDQWGNHFDGQYAVYNNLWGSGAGPQCIDAQSTTKWSVTSTQSGTGVKTYPNSSREPLGVTIDSLISLTSTMDTSSPKTGDYCTAWDIWAPEEVMIWINKYGNVAPWGSFIETAEIGGETWDVYKNGYPGFVLKRNVDKLTVDAKAILDYCVKKGWLKKEGIIEKVQGGFEITATKGKSTFVMNDYSVSIKSTQKLEEPHKAAPVTEDPVAGPWYKLLAGHSGKALCTENGATNDGANVVQWSYKNERHQEWKLEEASDAPGFYRLINRASGMCLQVQGWNTGDGGNIQIGKPQAHQKNQLFSIKKEGKYYQVINENSKKLVDVQATSVKNGGNVHQWSYYSKNAEGQRWSFQQVEGTGGGITNPAVTLGDVDKNGAVNIVDALLIAQYYVGLKPANFLTKNADVSCDEKIDIVDALLVASFYVGKIKSFCK